MTLDEAKAEAKHLFGLFPSLNEDQLKGWIRDFERYDQPIVREAVKRYYREGKGGFVVPASLLGAISTEIGRRAKARTQLDVIGAATVAYWRDVDKLIEATPDDELACWRDTILGDPATGAGARAMLEKRDPRKSKTLKGMIYDAITKAAKGAAA